jgi:cytochrome c peroxidase
VKRIVALALVLAACPRGKDRTIEPGSNGSAGSATPATIELPPAPPLPELPKGLPAVSPTVTPEAVAFGAALFADPHLSKSGKTSCATCHDPAHGFSGTRQNTDAGAPNLRRTAALANLAWQKAFGWDGRYTSLDEQLGKHIAGQLGAPIGDLAADPTYAAHLARAKVTPEAALAAYVVTRYEGDSAWDREEGGPKGEHAAGYALYMGKAQCAVCHPPPLYTDGGFHRLGLIASHDEGRGRVDPKQQGAFATPTLRGATRRPAFFHDGSAATLDAAIDWHLAGGTGQGADPSIVDPPLAKVTLTPAEREQLGAFVRALTKEGP